MSFIAALLSLAIQTAPLPLPQPGLTSVCGVPSRWATGPAPTLDCDLGKWGGAGTLLCVGSPGTPSASGLTALQSTGYTRNGFKNGVGFDGSAGSFVFGDVYDQAGSFTLCYTVNPDAVAVGGMIFTKDGVLTGARAISVTQGSGTHTFYVFKDATHYSAIVIGVTAAQWSPVCFSYQYVADGSSIIKAKSLGVVPSDITNAVGPPANVSASLQIGRRDYSSPAFYKGKIGRITLWSGWAASTSELATLVAGVL